MRQLRLFILVLFVCIGCGLFAAQNRKNIIVMIPDGTGHASLTVARQLKGEALAIDEVLCGIAQTQSVTHFVTDSAAAGTAMSCGERTYNGAIGVDVDRVPLLTFGEWAQQQGKAVGIVTTDAIVGATPAAFSAHAANRNEAEALIDQQISSGFEVFMGGGASLLTDERKAFLRERGYALPTDAETLHVAQGKIFGLFAPGILTAMVERRASDTCKEPTLCEMTAKALEVLAQDEDGFFLMVEGAQVDKGNHEHDLPWATYELLAFDDTVGMVLDWAETHGDTLVVIAPDHETGGLTLLDDTPSGVRVERLKAATSKAAAPASSYNVHYSSTWHTGVDVFYASNDPSVRPVLNKNFRVAITGSGATHLEPLTGTTEIRDGIPYLLTPDGATLRAHRDAIYLPSTQKWYAR